MNRGRLIVFEGIDGVGKTTQIKRAHNYLVTRDVLASIFREPGATPLGESLRGLILSKDAIRGGVGDLAEFLMFAAARAEICRLLIKPLLAQGATVLLDRFGLSSVAYQGYGRGVDVEFIKRVNAEVTDGLRPDLTLLFDLDPQLALDRIERGPDRIEKSGLEFFQRVRRGYLEQAAEAPETCKIVDASQSVEDAFREVVASIDLLFKKNHGGETAAVK